MASTQALKSRIRSVKSTKQITKAMQLVAASKMRRAQDADKASAPYTKAASELLSYLASQGASDEHPLFARRHIKARLIIVVSSDKGLAGAYNSNILKTYLNEYKQSDAESVKVKTITVGRKVGQFVGRLKDAEVVGAYEGVADQPSGRELHAILDTARDMFMSGEVDAVDVLYTEFISSLTQKPRVQRLLPAGFTAGTVSDSVRDAKYEPSPEVVLDSVVTRLIGAQLYQALLDARASEHSMRMIAMKNATDNANDLVDDLTLEMNKARQGAITQELAEISGGVEALNE
ncbi:ATP synthase F1 subunit gamma [Candidatus Saccharibacteria bacterium]|nr:ATP synthase F1 subunit gamma [Candidatus Saccharibacteria bacterium]